MIMKKTVFLLLLTIFVSVSAAAAFAADNPGKIVFVCTGNTCRSPMAEGIAKKISAGCDYAPEIISRATKIDPDEVVANPNAVLIMAARGIDIRGHQSKMMAAEDAKDASLILTMTAGHKENVLKLFPAAAPYTFTLIEYVTGQQGNISDPWGMDLVEYEKTAAQLEELIPAALEKYCGTREQAKATE